MENFDYKKYALGKLEEFVHDSLTSAEATPEEIYDVIKKAVEENYYIYKNQTKKCYELLALLNGNGKSLMDNVFPSSSTDDVISFSDTLTLDKAQILSTPMGKKDYVNDFWQEYYYPEEHKESKVKKWVLPVEEDAASGEYYLQLPDDLLEQVNWNEGDELQWQENEDGSFLLRKVTKPIGPDEC